MRRWQPYAPHAAAAGVAGTKRGVGIVGGDELGDAGGPRGDVEGKVAEIGECGMDMRGEGDPPFNDMAKGNL